MPDQNPREAAEDALKQARAASRRNDLAAAERWSKTAERLALAAEKLASLPPTEDDEEETERLRCELRLKLQRYCEAYNEQNAWEREAFAHYEALARGETPEPLSPAPCGPIDEHDVIERIKEIIAGRADKSTLETPNPPWPWDENGKSLR